MASSLVLHNLCSVSSSSPNCHNNQTITSVHSHFLSSKSVLRLKEQSFASTIRLYKPEAKRPRLTHVIFAAQSNFLKGLCRLYFEVNTVFQTVWKVGKDGIEAGTNLVPDSVPRPIARTSVTILAVSVSLFVLKSFLSTAFFVLGTMGLVYFIFLALNKDQRPGGGVGSDSDNVEDPLEEARRIMEKYK